MANLDPIGNAGLVLADQAEQIGYSTDNELTPTISGEDVALMIHAHSAQKVYPSLANGITLTGAAGAWALGVIAAIIPINTITDNFDIHSIEIEAYNANDTFEIVLYSDSGGTKEIGRVRVTRITNVGASPSVPFMCKIQLANTGIWGAVASKAGTSNTITISLRYHQY